MAALKWDDPDPVFLDFETQSACDLRAVGGRLYAADPSTRVLSLVVNDGDYWHVWLPRVGGRVPDLSQVEIDAIAKYGVDPNRVWLYTGDEVPEPIIAIARSGRTLAAHNALAFDRFIWDQFVGVPAVWCDTLYIARLAGLPGGLDKLTRAALNAGKDAARMIVEPMFYAAQFSVLADGKPDDWRPGRGKKHKDPSKARGGYDPVPLHETPEGVLYVGYTVPLPGQVAPLLRYNLSDVVLLRELYHGVLADVAVEADVIEAHLACNDGGVAADRALLTAVTNLSAESAARAGETLAELTRDEAHPDGALNKANYRSGPQVHAWLDTMGVKLKAVDAAGNAKASLRKDVIEQALADPRLMLDEDSPFAAASEINPVVFDVLRVRSAALRITGAKTARADKCLSPDGRFRDGHTYHQAHTGRDSSNRFQFHNMTRPKAGLDVNHLLADFEAGGWGAFDPESRKALNDKADFDRIAAKCATWTAKLREKNPRAGTLTVDDALGALIRPCLTAADGCDLAVVDYATVEVRGLAWIAGEETLLQAFRDGQDVYRLAASRFYGKPPEEVTDDERQLFKIITLGCGYGLGVEKFRLYAAANGIDLVKASVTAEQCIDAFRSAYPAIAGTHAGQINGRAYRRGGIWDKLDAAAMAAVGEGRAAEAGRCLFTFDGKVLRVELPSGRRLHYRGARIEDRVPGYVYALGLPEKTKATLVYDNPRGFPATMYGGKWAENVVQALCREPLMGSAVELNRRGMRLVLRVHDELVAEFPSDRAADGLREMCEVMSTPPAWAAGFPLAVEGFVSRRYVKKPAKGSVTCDARLGVAHMGVAK